MTRLLEQAFEKVLTLPDAMQDQAAHMLLAYAGGDEPAIIKLTPQEEADLVEAQAEVARGEVASPAELEAVLSKYRF